jgi:hypothetical protein
MSEIVETSVTEASASGITLPVRVQKHFSSLIGDH